MLPSAELIRSARSATRRRLGRTLADKATDAFCVNAMLGVPRPTVLEGRVWEATTSDGREARVRGWSDLLPVHESVRASTGNGRRAPRGDARLCWLNGSLRTEATANVVADVAADPAVVVVDIARSLRSAHDGVAWSGRGGAHPSVRNGHAAVALPENVSLDVAGQRVALIDSEVCDTHPALRDSVVHRADFTGEGWGRTHRHGTALAGLIASTDREFPGVAPGVAVWNYKILASDRRLDVDDFGAALALQHALEDGVSVALCAWGAGPIADQPSRLARAVNLAWSLGLVVVTSAGNCGPRRGSMSSPAEAHGVLVVGATDIRGTAVEPYSSRGPVGDRPGPHCVAPGGSWGTDPAARLTCARPRGGFGPTDVGTSYAAAFVVGAAVLHLSLEPGRDPDQVRDRIVTTATPLTGETVDAQGAGVLTIAL